MNTNVILCCRGAGCLSGVGTYLPGIVLQGCKLFKRCRNLPAWHCVAGVQAVQVVSDLPAGHCVAVVQSV